MNQGEICKALKGSDVKVQSHTLVFLYKSGTLSELKLVMGYFQACSHPKLKQTAVKVASHIIRTNLIKNYQSLKPSMCKSLAKLMGGMDPQVVNAIADDLKSENNEIRLHAICILGLMGTNPRTRELLEELVTDRSEKVRATAISLMKELVDRKDMTLIIKMLKDTDNRVVANTVETIESIQRPQQAILLVKYMDHPNNRVRGNVLKALWNLGHYDIYKSMQNMAEDPEDYLMRTSACWVMGELFNDTDYEYLALLSTCLQDKHPLVRENAIKAFLKIGGDSLTTLREMANRNEIEAAEKQLYPE